MGEGQAVSHEWGEETPEAKARWFRALGMADRMQIFCDLTDLALSIHPSLPEKQRAEPTAGRIQIIAAP